MYSLKLNKRGAPIERWRWDEETWRFHYDISTVRFDDYFQYPETTPYAMQLTCLPPTIAPGDRQNDF